MTNITHEYYFTLRHSSGGVLYKLKLYERRPLKWYRWKHYRKIDEATYLTVDLHGVDGVELARLLLNNHFEVWVGNQTSKYWRKTPLEPGVDNQHEV